jgi:hypothetical protein
MRSFFGLANQTCNFSDEISEILHPLKVLLKKGSMFQWLPEHESAFLKAKELLSSPKTLAYYDPRRQTRLQVDASRLKGLGFVLKQLNQQGNWETVQAGSRFLSEAETRYAMIELELLAIVWACQKCRMFVEGLPKSRFMIWTDHQPLIPIVSKYTLPQITNRRLQRLRMKIDHLQFVIQWVKGKDNVEADALSRAPHAEATLEDEIDELDSNGKIAKLVINSMDLNPPNEFEADARLKEVFKASKHDEEYIDLVKMIREGFPHAKAAAPANMASFWHAREHLHFDEDGFIVYRNRLFIPKSLRTTLLKRLLAMHQAADKMMARARQCIWWPLLTKDVKNIAMTCKPCQEYKPSNPAEKLIHHECPVFPYQYVHADFCQYEGKHYLIVIDQFSGYPHVSQFNSDPTTDMLIEQLMAIFSLFSIPVKIYSDGGPQFTAKKFVDFCQTWGITNETSSPHHPQSNGYVETAVKQMKKLIRGTFVHSQKKVNSEDFSAGILLFRNTPCSPTDRSPAEILFGRQIRDNLPISRNCLKPNLRFDVEKRRRDAYEKQSKYHSRKVLPLLQPGTRVFVQHPATKRWTQEGVIESFGHNEREYLVRLDVNDRILRRNRRFLRPQHVQTSDPPRQPVPVPASEKDNLHQDGLNGRKRTYAEVAKELNCEVPASPISRPRRVTRKPVRFADENFVYKIKT